MRWIDLAGLRAIACALIAPFALAWATAADAEPRSLTSAEAIRAVRSWPVHDVHPVRIEGTLTLLDEERHLAVVQDATGATAFHFPIGTEIPVGHRVLLEARDSTPYLDALPDFPLRPSGQELLTSLEGPSDWGKNYVARIHGYLYPPVSGDYQFWISSDDTSQLWLGTDDRASSARPIAHVYGWTKPGEWNYLIGQKSAPVSLVAGQRYYIEVVHEQRIGSDHVSVSWQGPGFAQQIVPGEFLSPPEYASLASAADVTGSVASRGRILREYWRNETVRDAATLMEPRRFRGLLTLAGATLEDRGTGELPTPQSGRAATPWQPDDAYRWTAIDGVVDFAAKNGETVALELIAGALRIRAVLMSGHAVDAERLTGRRLHLEGVAEPALNSAGEPVLGTLWVPPAPHTVVLSDWPSSDRYPLASIAELLATDSSEISRGPLRVRGRVVAVASNGTTTLRDQGAFYAYVSPDGRSWREIGQPVEIELNEIVEAGLFVTSRSTETLATARFDHATGIAEPLAGADIGNPTRPGKIERTGDDIALTGGGHDVWAKPDQCFFAHHPVTGADGIVVRVAAFDAGEGWAKCGIMFRDGLATDVHFAALVLTPENGCSFQWRGADGPVLRTTTRDRALRAPLWLKLERRFNTMTVEPTDTPRLTAGEWVEATGYVSRDAHRTALIAASLRKIPPQLPAPEPLMVPPRNVSIAQLRGPSGSLDIRQVSQLRAFVTYFGRFRDEKLMAVQDDTDALFVSTASIPEMPTLRPGCWVDLQLMPTTDLDATEMVVDRLSVTGTGAFPDPVRAPLHNALPHQGNAAWLEIAGVVRAAAPDGTLEVRTNTETFAAAIDGFTPEKAHNLVDAAVTLRGAYLHRTDQERVLLVPSPDQVSAVPAPAPSPFDAPVRRLGEIGITRLRAEASHRIVVHGTITYLDRAIGYLQDETGGVRVEFDAPPHASIGDAVTAAGFPDLGADGWVTLKHTVARSAGSRTPLDPVAASGNDVAQRKFAGELVTVVGTVTAMEVGGAEQTIDLQAERLKLRATLARGAEPLRELPLGTIVRVTGVCLVDNAPAEWTSAPTAPATTAQVWLRSAQDMTVLQTPRWWLVKRTLWVVSIGAAILVFAASWIHLLRRRVAQRTAELRTTMEKLREETENAAVLAERNRLATEIHDSLEQGFSGLILQLDTTAKLNGCTPEIRSGLAIARNMVAFSRNEVRHAVWDLHSPALDQADLGKALRNIVAQIAPETIQSTIAVNGTARRLNSTIEHHALRVAQEAITNAVKHAKARRLEVDLTFGADELRLSVRDDGCGFLPDRVMTGGVGHFGLRSLRSRAAKIGGVLTVSSVLGQGTTVELRAPLASPAI